MLRKLLLFSVLCFIVVANRESLFTYADDLWKRCQQALTACNLNSLKCANPDCISEGCLDPSHR